MTKRDRRTVLKIFTGALGGGAAAQVVVPIVSVILAPGRKDTVTQAEGFIPVGLVASLPEDGTPLSCPVMVEKPRNAWAVLPPTRVGAVFVRRVKDRLVACSSVCPHLGCRVDFNPEKKQFGCPCHESAFDLEGRVLAGPSPRPLDALEVRAVDSRIEVRFRQFQSGTKRLIPIG